MSAIQFASDSRGEMTVLAALGVAIAATRMDHFGGALALPDASLAAFFLAGLWLRASWAFPALLLVACGVDLAALAQAGLGADCLSPAYPFLIAAYGALWGAGRRCGTAAKQTVIQHIVVAVSAAAIAFVISNLSWFAFSGHFSGASLQQFVTATLPQAPRYLGWAVAYTLLGLFASRALGERRFFKRVDSV